MLGLASVLAAAASCAPAHAPAAPAGVVPVVTLVDTAGVTTTLPADLAGSRLTVVVFYAEHCPCFSVHDDRLRELASVYGPQGVRVMVVDSEVSATAERDARAAAARGLPAITMDPGAKLADALDAVYATYTVVLDGQGQIRYRGGLDSDKARLHDDATSYIRDALDDLLAGREPRRAEGKALGCALQKH